MDKVSMNFFSGLILLCDFIQEGRGHRAVYYTSPQSFIITLISWLNNFNLLNFDWLVQLVKCPYVSTTNCNLQRG